MGDVTVQENTPVGYTQFCRVFLSTGVSAFREGGAFVLRDFFREGDIFGHFPPEGVAIDAYLQ